MLRKQPWLDKLALILLHSPIEWLYQQRHEDQELRQVLWRRGSRAALTGKRGGGRIS